MKNTKEIQFTESQIKEASEMCQFNQQDIVANEFFGDEDRFKISLVKTRFCKPCVFIHDADQEDEVSLSLVVWQGDVEDLQKGINFVINKYQNAMIGARAPAMYEAIQNTVFKLRDLACTNSQIENELHRIADELFNSTLSL